MDLFDIYYSITNTLARINSLFVKLQLFDEYELNLEYVLH